MVVPCGKHRGVERSELLRRFPSYALWAHRTVEWLTLTSQEEYDCKVACIRRSGDISVRYWQPWINYDEMPRRLRRRRHHSYNDMTLDSRDGVPW